MIHIEQRLKKGMRIASKIFDGHAFDIHLPTNGETRGYIARASDKMKSVETLRIRVIFNFNQAAISYEIIGWSGEKQCPICLKILPIKSFPVRHKGGWKKPDGHDPQCLECKRYRKEFITGPESHKKVLTWMRKNYREQSQGLTDAFIRRRLTEGSNKFVVPSAVTEEMTSLKRESIYIHRLLELNNRKEKNNGESGK